ncbi:LysM peptidoglycan-binding domain-containing protein [Haloferula sp.]|uniref:LysM peptidoglycan-binding domain-containing protein n=1 Tax=Haloferula sp. TaxID=2497595 RepID=UPI00329B4792
MILRTASRASWLLLLAVTIYSVWKLADSHQENLRLSDRLKTVAEETAKNEESAAAELAEAQADLAAQKEALLTKKGEMEQFRKRASLERELVLREAAEKRKTLTAGMAKVLTRFGFSPKELETLLDDLPVEDRLPLLEQITALKAADSEEVEEPRTAEVETTPSPGDMPEKKPLPDPKTTPAESSEQASAEAEPSTEEKTKKDTSKPVSYTVKPGDTLTRVGRKFDVEVAQLMKLNGISNPNMVRVGQVLKIPQN